MTKIISFSLWGNNPKYGIGMVRNAEIAAKLFPDWECWVHFPLQGAFGPTEAFVELSTMSNVRLVAMHLGSDMQVAESSWKGMFWRFEPAADPRVEVMLSRDCDSRLGEREKAAVDEWLASDRGFHIMRDHPWHGSQILGGMWGVKKGVLSDMRALMRAWKQEDRWQTDQDFLNAVIYPRVVDNSMVHAQFFGIEPHVLPFPTRRQGFEFVGQVFDERDVTVAEHQTALMKALKSQGEPIRREHLPKFLQ